MAKKKEEVIQVSTPTTIELVRKGDTNTYTYKEREVK